MGQCTTCQEESKYKCPKCERLSCSLACVKDHKIQFSCSGKVDPTRFITRDDLTASEVHLRRDYQYLTQFKREVELDKGDLRVSAPQVFKRPNTHTSQQFHQNKRLQLDPRVSKLKQVFGDVNISTKRQNTLVVSVATGMARSMANKSGYDKRSGQFVWTVEWIVMQEGKVLKKFLSNRIREAASWLEAFPTSVIEKVDANFKAGHVFLEKVGNKGVLELNINETITDTLKDKVVVEYPTVYVVATPDDLDRSVVESSDESESEDSSSDSSDDSSSDSEPEVESSRVPIATVPVIAPVDKPIYNPINTELPYAEPIIEAVPPANHIVNSSNELNIDMDDDVPSTPPPVVPSSPPSA